MKFSYFSQQLQNLEQESSRNTMTKMLADLFNKAQASEINEMINFLLESFDAPYKNKQFNIADKGIIVIIASLVAESEEKVTQEFKKLGDLGLTVQFFWQGKDTGISVLEVYQALEFIADITGTGSTEKKVELTKKLLERVDAVSAKFIIRMISKTLRLGFSDMTILDALSWMQEGNKSLSKQLEEAYNICADLGLVAKIFKQKGLLGIKALKIQVGIPIRPAAAERLKSSQAIIEKIGHCIAQPKLDGFRVQLHVKKTALKTEVHFFSRNLLDMSQMFPELTDLAKKLDVESLICEGEAIVYDQDTQTFLPFQQTVKRKRKHGVEQASQDFPLRLYLFDILYLNGQSLLEKTHQQRREILLKVIKSVKDDSLQVIEEKKITNIKELEDYFLTNIQAGLEGLVVKRDDSIYQPGKRNFNWIKLKRESHATLIDTIDVVIFGYYVGQGKRAKFGIGAFLVGIYNRAEDHFETVAKVGTGMSDDEWKILKKRCDHIAVKQQPKNVICSKELYPDVWVAPEIVCTVKSDEITWSPLHTAGKTTNNLGLALRFPRFIEYRDDKSAQDATTLVELQQLFKQQKIKK